MLNNLSDDLKRQVFTHVSRPTDLVSLCLACKSFHELIVPILYKTICLDVGSEADKRIASLLNPRNLGLRYIRNVELYKAEVEHECNQQQQSDFAIRLLLEFLPEDALDKFSWHPWRPFSSDNLKLLYQKQKKMKCMEAIALDKPISQEFIKSLKLEAAMDRCTKLGLYPDSRDTLQLANELLKRLKKVEKITLHANFGDAEVEIPASELQDTPTEPGLVTRTLFAHMLPFDKCTPLTLREITLQNVHVRFASDTYCRVIDFTHLKTLRIFNCLGADSLIAALCKSSNLPLALQSLEFKHDDDSSGEATTALNTLLTLLSSLRRLYIDISNAKSGPITEAAVTRHGKTLVEMLVHSYEGDPSDPEDEEHLFSTEDFVKICSACTKLEQLSVAFPATPIFRMTDDYSRWVAAVATSLPKLVTLNVTTWPTNSPSSSRLPRKAYEWLLQGMAQETFEASKGAARLRKREEIAKAKKTTESTPPDATADETEETSTSTSKKSTEIDDEELAVNTRLTTIAFGTSDKIFERIDPKTCIVYMRGSLISPTTPNNPTNAAVPVSWSLRKYEESRSDVLDFALARAIRPPCREGIGGSSPLGGRGNDDDEETSSEESEDEDEDGGDMVGFVNLMGLLGV